jgi:hypothetical protein
LVAATPATAGAVLSYRTFEGDDYRLRFDPRTISADRLVTLARLSPHLTFEVEIISATMLELCVDGDVEYLDCGSRDVAAPNFLANARINLSKAEPLREFLETLMYPAELQPVVAYLSTSLSFSLYLAQAQLEFYTTWNLNALKRRWETLDPSQICAQPLRAIESASSIIDKYGSTKYEWHNCLNTVFRRRLGPYPQAAWDRFLRRYGITEEVTGTGHSVK